MGTDESVDLSDDGKKSKRESKDKRRRGHKRDRRDDNGKKDDDKRSRRSDRGDNEDKNRDGDDDDRSVSRSNSDTDEVRRQKSRKKKRDRERDRKHRSSRKHQNRRSRSRNDERKRRSKKKSSKSRRRRRRRSYSSSSSSSESSSSDSSSSDSDSSSSSDDAPVTKKSRKVVNSRLLAKLAAKGESLEEWRERKSQKRAAKINAKFGYTAEENPFNDPNLHETFTWKKKDEKEAIANATAKANGGSNENEGNKKFSKDYVFDEIEKVRERRKNREIQFQELERLRAEESRMKELENYDDWVRKEEEFHLRQQKQRSAIRLVEGREKPIDVLAKNLLLFGFSSAAGDKSDAVVKYQEKYNIFQELDKNIDVELEEPYKLLNVLKQNELTDLLVDINAFIKLEKETDAAASRLGSNKDDEDDDGNMVLNYWTSLECVAEDEIKYLKTGGSKGTHAKMIRSIKQIFVGQSKKALTKMQQEIEDRLRNHKYDKYKAPSQQEEEPMDVEYWESVLQQLKVHLAKVLLSELHSKMLVCQLEKLEQRKEELSKQKQQQSEDGENRENSDGNDREQNGQQQQQVVNIPTNVTPEFGDLEEELGLKDEIDISDPQSNTGKNSDVAGEDYMWLHNNTKYRPRKPRYFNRVKTGYDWNKYNQTHYDHDNPPPKTVQGYKFNIFYPDLIDPISNTPRYFIEPIGGAKTTLDGRPPEFCLLRFSAGPPYEDIAFKIINREWNKSRKRGFKCTFERGVLSLYFNFTTHWYRR